MHEKNELGPAKFRTPQRWPGGYNRRYILVSPQDKK